jgi:hypothetical protein
MIKTVRMETGYGWVRLLLPLLTSIVMLSVALGNVRV